MALASFSGHPYYIYSSQATPLNKTPWTNPQCAMSRNTPLPPPPLLSIYSAVYDNPNAIVSLAARRYHHQFCFLVPYCIVLAFLVHLVLLLIFFRFDFCSLFFFQRRRASDISLTKYLFIPRLAVFFCVALLYDGFMSL